MVEVKNLILGAIIAVILVMFLAYGTNLAYEAPDYNKYCPQPVYPTNETPENCAALNGTWTPQDIQCIKAPCPQGYCDYYSKCQPVFERVNELYSKNMFIIALVIGLIIIAVSALIISVPSVSGGLMLGSLFFIIYGTGRYWQYMNDWFRFIILGIVLVILVYLGYRLANRNAKKKRR